MKFDTQNILNILIILAVIVIGYLLYQRSTNSDDNLDKTENIYYKDKQKKNKKKKHHKKHKKHKKDGKNKKKKEDLVFLEIGMKKKSAGKIIIRLFSDIVPKTCQNFRTLCEREMYKNSPFHRIINNFMIQGGDYTEGNGTGGKSIYGKNFPDENFKIKHNRPYLLSMANKGKDTNGSQFFITTNKTPHLDKKHVVFGEVVDGFELVDALNEVETDRNDKPLDNIRIIDCGIYKT